MRAGVAWGVKMAEMYRNVKGICWDWNTFKKFVRRRPSSNHCKFTTGQQFFLLTGLLSGLCSFLLFYQVWLMTKADRFSSFPNRTQQEPDRCLLIWGAWHQSEAPEHIRHTHACLRAHSYTNKTGRHANTCARTHIPKHAEWWTGTIMILNNW